MKNIIYILICHLLINNIQSLQSQNILKRMDQYVLIDFDQSSGIKIGDQVKVLRKTTLGDTIDIGMVSIVKFQSSKCAGKIINENPGDSIRLGDFIKMLSRRKENEQMPDEFNKMFNKNELLPDKSVNLGFKIVRISQKYVLLNPGNPYELNIGDKLPVYKPSTSGEFQKSGEIKIVTFQNGQYAGKIIKEINPFKIVVGDFLGKPEYKSGVSNLLTYGSLGIGITATGLGYWFNYRADRIYSDYISAETTKDAIRLYDNTVKMDKQSKIAYDIGGGMIAIGILYQLF